MSAKERILEKIKKNKPQTFGEIQSLEGFGITFSNLLEAFKAKLEKGGAAVSVISADQLEGNFSVWEKEQDLVIYAPSRKKIINDVDARTDKHVLKQIQLSVLEAKIGVAENGAMWIDESNFPHRAIPFITQDLVLIINQSDLVSNMHEAYQRINISESGYGVFISGPSKTADIEQSLVIGAHGAKSLQVFIIK